MCCCVRKDEIRNTSILLNSFQGEHFIEMGQATGEQISDGYLAWQWPSKRPSCIEILYFQTLSQLYLRLSSAKMSQSEKCMDFPLISDIGDNIELFHKPLIASIFFNVVLAISATLGNGMIIVAILRSQNLQTPSYLLITSLAFTDLLVGLFYHPLIAIQSVLLLMKNVQRACDMRLLAVYQHAYTFLVGVSILMTTCISIDRYLALTLRHRYRVLVTKTRVRIVIVVAWFVALIWVIGTVTKRLQTYINISISVFLLLGLLLITCTFYIKSFITLHRYTSQVHAQQPNPSQGNFDVVKYKKTLKTMVAILGCFLLCLVPGVVSMFAIIAYGFSKEVALLSAIALVIFRLNPVIYLARFTDIRPGVYTKFWERHSLSCDSI